MSDTAGVGASFEARFDSECDQCGMPIEAGDRVGWVDDEVVCGTCYDRAAAE